MLKFLQVAVGCAAAYLTARYVDDNLVGAAMVGLIASLAVTRLWYWRHPMVWDAETKSWHLGEPVQRRRS